MFKTSPRDSTLSLISPGNDQLQIPLKGKFGWEAIPDVDYYYIQVSEYPDFKSFVYNVSNITPNNFEYSDLKLNKQYYWHVRYFRGNKSSNWSNIWIFTTVAPDSLPVPQMKNPVDGKIGVPINGSLTWSAIPNAQSYQISLSINRNFNTIFLKNSDIIETMFIYSNLEFNQTYYWRVSALADNAKSTWTTERSFLTELEMPVILFPYNNSIDQLSDGGILWSVSDDIALYHVQIATDSLFGNIISEGDNLYEMNYAYNLPIDTTYFCRVKSYNDSNQSRWSKVVKFATKNTTDVKDEEFSNSVYIFPNPAKDCIYFKPFEGYRILILNTIGEIVLIAEPSVSAVQRVDISKLPAGLYFIKIGNRVEKFLKM
jgi:hypothetical protein